MRANELTESIRRMVDIREVALRYGLHFNYAGFARCPFHHEKTASFKLENKSFGHCFGCNKNTDAVGLTMQLLGLDYLGAAKRLNDDFGLGLPISEKPNLRRQSELRQRLAEMEQKEQDRAEKIAMEHKYLILWCMLDQWKMNYAPKSADEKLDGRYVMALQNLDHIAYLLDKTREEVRELGRKYDR